jgi:hypothetical protein
MKYLKHYWISVVNGGYCCHENPVLKRHPEAEFPGLDVRIWMHDANGIDVCLSAVPDTTEVNDITDVHDANLKVVQVLTEVEYNSIATPYGEAGVLSAEAQQARLNGNETLATQKEEESQVKYQEALTAIRAL